MSKFSPQPTNDSQRPRESAKEFASRMLNNTFRDVFYQASGRNLTPEFETVVADNCYDIVSALMEAVDEEARQNRRAY